MTAAASRHHYSYSPSPYKTLPITMPSKSPAGYYPVSRVAVSPPDLSDASTVSGGRTSAASYSVNSDSYAGSVSGDYETSSGGSYNGVDVVDMLSDRMNSAFDPIRLDKNLAKQAKR